MTQTTKEHELHGSRPFLDRLIERIDRVDPASLQAHFLSLAEQQGLLETIFQSIQEGVLVLDADGSLNFANQAAARLLGFDPVEAVGRLIARVVRDIDWRQVLDIGEDDEWARLMTREIEVSYPEHRFVSFYAVPLGMESERGGAVVILRDVTRDRLEEANVLESERFNAIKLLAAGIAHEVGNPLNALNIHLQLLDREIQGLAARLDAPPESSQESVEEVAADLRDLVGVAREEVTRLDLIISQFLGAIRPTQPNLARTRVEGLLEETLNLLRLEVTNRDIEISIECPEPVPDIRVDRDQMKQAFFNIVRNAFQAMPDGGRLTIRLSSTSQDLVIAFEDSGKGIKREDMGRVFEPYYTSKSKGSGLGLLVVQRIVREHGGALEVSSRESIGTRFVITLPLAERRIRMIGDATKLPIEVGEAIPVELDHADEEGVDSGQ